MKKICAVLVVASLIACAFAGKKQYSK